LQQASPRIQKEISLYLRKGQHRTARRLKQEGLRRKEGRWKPCPPNSQYPGEGQAKEKQGSWETQVPTEPCAKSVAEELLMRVIRLEPVEGTSRESWGRRRRTNTESVDVCESLQQLKQAQLAIAELYQQNRELRQQLAAKTLEVSASQGREGNATCLKRQLKEAQDTIIQLCETQMVSEERNVKHFRECVPAMEKVCTALASEQKKLKGNAILQRQVTNLKRRHWSLRRKLRVSKLQTRPDT
jgi:hypothetical protein